MYSMLKEIEKHLDRWEEKKEVVTAVMVVAVAMEAVEVVGTLEVEVAVLVVAEVHLGLAREVKSDAEVPHNPEVHVIAFSKGLTSKAITTGFQKQIAIQIFTTIKI